MNGFIQSSFNTKRLLEAETKLILKALLFKLHNVLLIKHVYIYIYISKMDKRAKDKLVRSSGENGRMPKKIFTQELEGTRRSGRPRKRWKEEVERRLQVMRMRRWRKLVTDRKKTEGYCSTGQSAQRAVVPMEEKKNIYIYIYNLVCVYIYIYIV